jgi:hypothetical protein
MNETLKRLLAIENDIARNCMRGTEAAIEFHAAEKEKLINKLEKDFKFKEAIENIFGTTDMNKLKMYKDAPEMIFKYVDGIFDSLKNKEFEYHE